MKNYIDVHITGEDIGWANTLLYTTGLAYTCPIAQALNRENPDYMACVFHDRATLYKKEEFPMLGNLDSDSSITLRLSRSAQRFITRYDNGKPVKPTNFRLEKE